MDEGFHVSFMEQEHGSSIAGFAIFFILSMI